MVLWIVAVVVLLGIGVVREIVSDPDVSLSGLLRIVEDWFLGSSLCGLIIAGGFGVPLGIVSVLSERERDVELEQQLDSPTSSAGSLEGSVEGDHP